MVELLLKRYLWLIDTLKRGGEMTFDEISDKWDKSSVNDNGSELTKRTFYNHCQAIARHFGIDIECRRGRGLNLYYITNPEAIEDNSLTKWAIDSFSLGELLLGNASISDKILLEEIPSGREWLELILQSLQQNLMVDITYENFVGIKFSGKVCPLCIKLFKRRWYVLGLIENNRKRIFSLDRIKNLCLTDKSFFYPKDFVPADYFHNVFGIVAGVERKVENIVIRTYAELPGYLRSLPIHHSQKELETKEGHTDFSIRLVPTFDFIQELLLHRDQLEVISPQSLREEVTEIVTRMNHFYNYDKYEVETIDKASPKLHNIISLQEEAARVFGMDPVQTYKLARGLYEKKRISFPGNSQAGISRRDYDDFKKNVYPRMAEAPCFKTFIDDGYRPVFTKSGKDEYSADHGIVLTAYPFVGLTQEEIKIIFLIGRRMMSTFSRSFRYRKTTVEVECAGQTFFNTYTEVIRPGYMSLRKPEDYAGTDAPNLESNQTVQVESVGSVTKTTSPPKPYKDAELIRDCHRVHLQEFQDGVVKDIMFLQSKGYLHRNRMGEYSLTESGKALNYIIRDMAISKPGVLVSLDRLISETAIGAVSEERFNSIIESHVTAITSQVLSCAKLFKPTETDIKCPKCGKGIFRIFGKIAKCTNPECGHTINLSSD